MERLKFIFYAFFAYLLLPVFLLVSWYRRIRGVDLRSPRILVIPVMRRIGDLVCATPVFRAIKLHRPEAHVAVVVGKNIIDLLRHNPRIDHLININDTPFKGFWGRGRFFLYIMRQRFDSVISLPVNPMHNLIMFFSFAPYRIKTLRERRSLAERLTDIFANYQMLYRDHTFLPGHYLKLLRPLGIEETASVKEVFLAEGADQAVDTFLKLSGVAQGAFVVGMSITAGNKIKEWGDEKFQTLAERFHRLYNATIVCIGSPADGERIDALRARLDPRRFLKAVHFTLEELPALMRRFNLFVSVDTGPLYIAHALGVPVIDITGPVDWREQPPEDEKSILVKPPPEIQPSSFVFKKPGTPEEHERALDAIGVDDVWKAVEEMMERIKKGF